MGKNQLQTLQKWLLSDSAPCQTGYQAPGDCRHASESRCSPGTCDLAQQTDISTKTDNPIRYRLWSIATRYQLGTLHSLSQVTLWVRYHYQLILATRKLQQEVTKQQLVPHLGIYPREMKMCTQRLACRFYSNIIHSSQKPGTIQMSTNKWMDKQNVVHPDNGI